MKLESKSPAPKRQWWGMFLAVQWLRFWASTAKGPGAIPDGEIRSHKPCDATKKLKKKKRKKGKGKEISQEISKSNLVNSIKVVFCFCFCFCFVSLCYFVSVFMYWAALQVATCRIFNCVVEPEFLVAPFGI